LAYGWYQNYLQQSAEKKFESIWQMWMQLKKHKNRQSDPGGNIKKKIVESLDKLWDVGATDGIITIQASRFLSDKK